MIKNLHKVQKKLSKKRGKLNALHENSRDSKILRRAGGREERLARLAAVTSKERQGFCKSIALLSLVRNPADSIFHRDKTIQTELVLTIIKWATLANSPRSGQNLLFPTVPRGWWLDHNNIRRRSIQSHSTVSRMDRSALESLSSSNHRYLTDSFTGAMTKSSS